MIAVGDRITVRARAVAHGGSMLAEALEDDGRATVFLRHALPGERGTAVVEAVRGHGRLVFADLVEVVESHPDRVAARCEASGPGGCGGCDFQHVALPAQRELKAAVVDDCLRRIARLDPADVPWDGTVHAVPGDDHGLRWRTRGRFAALESGLAMQRWRSAELIPIEDCLITRTAVVAAAAEAAEASGSGPISAVGSSTGELAAGPPRRMTHRVVHERVGGRRFEVAADGFWQVHPGAPALLTDAVATLLQPRRGESLLDLYAGVGLFAAGLAARLEGGSVHVVEGDKGAARFARRNLSGLANCRVHRAPVLPWLQQYRGGADLVVLDPPRSGAGAAVLAELDRLAPRAVAYVACDPAALARDLRTVLDLGWQLDSLSCYDMFPQTHHIEAVALLRPPRHGR